jgi:hypothetical protein
MLAARLLAGSCSSQDGGGRQSRLYSFDSQLEAGFHIDCQKSFASLHDPSAGDHRHHLHAGYFENSQLPSGQRQPQPIGCKISDKYRGLKSGHLHLLELPQES